LRPSCMIDFLVPCFVKRFFVIFVFLDTVPGFLGALVAGPADFGVLVHCWPLSRTSDAFCLFRLAVSTGYTLSWVKRFFGIAYFMIALRHLHYTIRTGLAVCFGLVNGFFLSLHAGVAVPVVPGAEPSLILLAGSHWQSSLGMTCSDVSQLHFMDCLHPRWSSRRHLFHALSAHDPFSLRPSPSFAVVGL